MEPEQFKAIREALGLTQRQLGEILGYVDRAHVSHMEKGSRRILPPVALVMRAFADGWRPTDWPA